MPDAYRALPACCPSCQEPLRDTGDRLCCDGCGGLQIELDRLTAELRELTQISPQLTFVRERTGKLGCPRCGQPMTTCRIDVHELDQLFAHIDKLGGAEWRKRTVLGKWRQRMFLP